jgi:hypothetical protein
MQEMGLGFLSRRIDFITSTFVSNQWWVILFLSFTFFPLVNLNRQASIIATLKSWQLLAVNRLPVAVCYL